MSDRRALYRRASFFEQRCPLICDMLCSSITRRSPSTCTRLVCLPIPARTLPLPHTHTRMHTRALSIQFVGAHTARPHNFGSFCCIFLPALSKKLHNVVPLSPHSFLATAQASQMDILIGTFGTVSILRWNSRQVSGWRGRAQADWCVASRA